jgi:hypothetical protein
LKTSCSLNRNGDCPTTDAWSSGDINQLLAQLEISHTCLWRVIFIYATGCIDFLTTAFACYDLTMRMTTPCCSPLVYISRYIPGPTTVSTIQRGKISSNLTTRHERSRRSRSYFLNQSPKSPDPARRASLLRFQTDTSRALSRERWWVTERGRVGKSPDDLRKVG